MVGNLIYKTKQSSKRGPIQTSQIDEPFLGGKALLKSLIHRGAGAENLEIERNRHLKH